MFSRPMTTSARLNSDGGEVTPWEVTGTVILH